jgi:hypothetical protein
VAAEFLGAGAFYCKQKWCQFISPPPPSAVGRAGAGSAARPVPGPPNTIAESELDHYPTVEEQQQGMKAELPVDADNHALGALRYLISKIDTGFIARWLKEQGAGPGADVDPTLTPIADPDETIRSLTTAEGPPEPPADRLRRLLTDPDAWTIINN